MARVHHCGAGEVRRVPQPGEDLKLVAALLVLHKVLEFADGPRGGRAGNGASDGVCDPHGQVPASVHDGAVPAHTSAVFAER